MWDAIKTVLNNRTSKCLILQDDEPRYVILTYEEYQHLQKRSSSSIVGENPEAPLSLHEVNGEMQDIQEVKKESSLRIEDLPF